MGWSRTRFFLRNNRLHQAWLDPERNPCRVNWPTYITGGQGQLEITEVLTFAFASLNEVRLFDGNQKSMIKA